MNTTRMMRAATAIAAGPLLALGLATGADAAPDGAEPGANDTPDNYTANVGLPDFPVFWDAFVTWDDYVDYDHSIDRDDLWVQDAWGDGYSTQLRVYWGGEVHTTHAYAGEKVRLDIGNVPNNKKVYFDVCQWDDGERIRCTDTFWFRE